MHRSELRAHELTGRRETIVRREFEHLIYASADKLATITFSRPERMNAMSYPAKQDFKAALELAAADSTVRVLVLRGEGRAFCTGIDLKDLSTGKIGFENFALWEECLRLVETMDKIVIALMHGYALGGGLQLGLACDLRIGTPSAKYGLPAAKEGLLPGLAVWRLAKFVGMGRAKELALWGDPIDGAEALRIGLVTRLGLGRKPRCGVRRAGCEDRGQLLAGCARHQARDEPGRDRRFRSRVVDLPGIPAPGPGLGRFRRGHARLPRETRGALDVTVNVPVPAQKNPENGSRTGSLKPNS